MANNKWWALLIAGIFCMGIFLSPLIPPFQSPDETDHIKRAFLLSQGQILTVAPPNNPSGGEISTGLIEYMDQFNKLPFYSNRKIDLETQYKSTHIEWGDKKVFSPTNGISFYFPLIYAPHAIALWSGKTFGLSVSDTYKFTRFICLITSCLILAAAFAYWAPSLLTGALLIIPMSLFQFASASIDGISTALAILSISIFLNIIHEKKVSTTSSIFLLTISLMVISTCRLQMLPCIGFLFALYFYKKDRRYLFAGCVALLLSLFWIAYATKTTVDFRVVRELSTAKILEFYIQNPPQLFGVFIRTLSNVDLIKSYLTSFIGVLGWLETSFPKSVYAIFGLLLALLTFITLKKPLKGIASSENLVLIVCAFVSIGIIFLALLITWTEHPAKIIMGVQGRYFLVPAILISYAISSRPNQIAPFFNLSGIILISSIFLFSGYETNKLLVQRYFTQQSISQTQYQKILVAPNGPQNVIPIKMSPFQNASEGSLRGLSIWLSPSKSAPPFKGKLVLQSKNGAMVEKDFDNNLITKEGWVYFSLPKNRYINGALSFNQDPQLTSTLIRNANGAEMSCLIYEYDDGTRMHTIGCAD